MATSLYGKRHKNMTSSKGICTCHHIRRFLHKSLAQKIYPHTGQRPDTKAEGRKKNMAKSVGAPF